MFAEYNGSIQRIVDSAIEMIYFMRGAISYNDMMLMTPGERDRVGSFVEKRLDQESKSPYPNY